MRQFVLFVIALLATGVANAQEAIAFSDLTPNLHKPVSDYVVIESKIEAGYYSEDLTGIDYDEYAVLAYSVDLSGVTDHKIDRLFAYNRTKTGAVFKVYVTGKRSSEATANVKTYYVKFKKLMEDIPVDFRTVFISAVKEDKQLSSSEKY